MRISKKIFFALLALIATLSAQAQVSFRVDVPPSVIKGERFNVVYTLKNADGSEPKISEIEGCKKLYGPAKSTASSMSIISGQTTSETSVSYTYVYVAEKEGTFTIPAASITANGKTYTTEQKTIKVLPPGKNQQAGGSNNAGSAPSQPSSRGVSPDDMFVSMRLNKTTVYENEAVECIVRLYTLHNSISSFTIASSNKFDDVLIEEVPLEPYLTGEQEHVKGNNYYIADIKKYILFPQKTGDIKLLSDAFQAEVGIVSYVNFGYGNRMPVQDFVSVSIPAASATLHVKPLPQPQPSDYIGAVGSFTLDSSLSSDNLRTGEAATYKLTLKGKGNIKFVQAPRVQFPSHFEVYPPNTTSDAYIQGATVAGSTDIEYTFVPQEPGSFTIPATTISYFNTAEGKYVTLNAPARNVTVAKGANGGTASIKRSEVKVENTDIRHIHAGNYSLSFSHTLLAANWWYWMLYPLLGLLFVMAVIIAGKRIRANADVTGRKMSRADKVARKRLSSARELMRKGKKDHFYDAILKALWGFASDKLAMPVSELTRANIADNLTEYGVPDDVTASFISILDECEMARYTPEDSMRPMQEIYNSASDVMKQLQSIKKTKK